MNRSVIITIWSIVAIVAAAALFQVFFRYAYLDDHGHMVQLDRLTGKTCIVPCSGAPADAVSNTSASAAAAASPVSTAGGSAATAPLGTPPAGAASQPPLPSGLSETGDRLARYLRSCPSLGARLDAVGFALDNFVEAMDYGNAPVNAKANAAWESARQNMGKASTMLGACAAGNYPSDYGYYAIEARYAHEGYIYDRLSDKAAYESFVRDLQHLNGPDRNDAEIDLEHIKQLHPNW